MHAFCECSHVINSWRQVELWIKKYIDKYYKQSDVEELVGNAIILATKEVIYRKRQDIGLPYTIHVK